MIPAQITPQYKQKREKWLKEKNIVGKPTRQQEKWLEREIRPDSKDKCHEFLLKQLNKYRKSQQVQSKR